MKEIFFSILMIRCLRYIFRANINKISRIRKMSTKESSEIDLSKYDLLSEGTTTILFPKNNVFYNPVQQYNRDLSSLCIKAFTELYADEGNAKKRNRQPVGSAKIPHHENSNIKTERIEDKKNEARREAEAETEIIELKPYAHLLEALSASGLRAIRYSKEIPLLQHIVANDLSSSAVKSIQLNINYNKASSKVKAQESNAITHMATNPSAYHIIDLDPYGTVSPFMDSAINAVKNGGLLCITCTDLGVLAGNGYPEKCFALYGGTNVWGDATHESALRLVLGMIARTAAKYGVAIEPVLSLSIDFYVRVFVRVWEKPIKVKELMSANEIIIKCSGCHATTSQSLGKMGEPDAKGRRKYGLAKINSNVGENCSYCGYINHMCGPMWSGPLHEKAFVDKVLKLVDEQKDNEEIYGTLKRVKGMLTVVKNELGDSSSGPEMIHDSQFYFKTTTISKVLKIPAPSIDTMCAALGNLGYEASLTHACVNSIKTNASWEVIWFIGKKLAEKGKLNIEKFSPTTAGYKILSNENIGKEIDLKEAMKNKGVQDGTNELEWLFNANEVSKRVNRLRKIKIIRFQENPTKNWGPKARPK